MPPIKQAMKQYPQNYSVESETDHSISLEYFGDEGCSSVVTLAENLDDFVSSCSDTSSDVSSPLHIEEIPHGALSPLNNNVSDKENSQDFDSNKHECPLPDLSWADPNTVWEKLCERDAKNAKYRSPNMLENHPSLKSRMRAILLDWLDEVCASFNGYII